MLNVVMQAVRDANPNAAPEEFEELIVHAVWAKYQDAQEEERLDELLYGNREYSEMVERVGLREFRASRGSAKPRPAN